MNILGTAVDWRQGWNSFPHIVVAVDELPSVYDLVHTMTNNDDKNHGGHYVWAEEDGYFHYFYWKENASGPHAGACGGKYKLTDGIERSFTNGWSSRAGCINSCQLIPYQILDVSILTPEYKRTALAGAITLDKIIDSLTESGIELMVEKRDWGNGEIYYVPMYKGKAKHQIENRVDQRNFGEPFDLTTFSISVYGG